jgi:phage terminase large subunit-like protein
LSPYRSGERRFGTKEEALEFHAELRDSVPDTASVSDAERTLRGLFRFRTLAAKNSKNLAAPFLPALAKIAGTLYRNQLLAGHIAEYALCGVFCERLLHQLRAARQELGRVDNLDA